MFENIRKMWEELANNAKIGLLAGVAGVAIFMLVLGVWLLSSDDEVLFTDLEPQDSAAIVSELEKMKVDYKLAQGGTRILVDEDEVYETRLKLLGKGVPLSGGVGFEIFDNSDIGMTEYAQKINYQRALQGELARTIVSLRQVKHARVHLVLPETSIFKQKAAQPKASVSLIVKPGAQFSSDHIDGIQRLIAASVPGLETSQVTIVDQSGMTLTRNTVKQSEVASANGQLEVKKQVENYLAKKVIAVLDRAFGPGQAIVSIDATLNLDHVKSTLENVIPVNETKNGPTGVIVRKRQSFQRPTGTGNGVSKAVANQSTYAGGGQRAASSTSETEYEIGRKIEQVVSTPGGIKRLSVGVLVPHTLSEEGMANIRNIAAVAVGFDTGRGDEIALHSVEQFLKTEPAEETQAGEVGVSMGRGVSQNTSGGSSTGGFRVIMNELTTQAHALIKTHPESALGVTAGVIVLLILLAIRTIQGVKKIPAVSERPSLSKKEREIMLAEIKRWITMEGQRPLDSGGKA